MSHRRQFWPPNQHLAGWIADQFEPGYQGWAIDVGASDGVSISTTYGLEHGRRWTVLCVDANPEYRDMLMKHRSRIELVACAAEPRDSAPFHVHLENPEAVSALDPLIHQDKASLGEGSLKVREFADHATLNREMTWKEIRVPVTTVDALLQKWEFPRLDALCIDVEGGELGVLKGSNLMHWKPRVVIAESWDEDNPELDGWLKCRGYVKVGRNVDNSLFLKEDAVRERINGR